MNFFNFKFYFLPESALRFPALYLAFHLL
ncbi:hypothetical protein ELI_4542 [Eubacterium callanderi]|uniref:Uncharacterized protein n=1 Tax=Eubacterium callanderi TaxID=53442 RepID=E3GR34_9FIRM|nr:hypothetical protein ELI_4542 [Eubacterium callanderi]